MPLDLGPKKRSELKAYFQPGAQPSAGQFWNLIDSFTSVVDTDGDSNKFLLLQPEPNYVSEFPNAQDGQIVWTGTEFRISDGAGAWVAAGGSGGGSGVWTEVAGGNDIHTTETDAKVGIGISTPQHPLDVNLALATTSSGGITTPGELVRLGRAAIGNSGEADLNDEAIFIHANLLNNSADNFALSQDTFGNTVVNAASGGSISFKIEDGGTQGIPVLAIADSFPNTVNNIPVIIAKTIAKDSSTGPDPETFVMKLATGTTAAKDGGGEWSTKSDIKVKENIRPYEEGLQQVLQINPVWFQYKQSHNQGINPEHVGIIANEMQKIAPHMVEAFPDISEAGTKVGETLYFDGSALKYMLVNAIKELSAKVESLESQLQKLKAE